MRIGIDVGGTHTDAVILAGGDVIASTKALTTSDVMTGIQNALDTVMEDSGVKPSDIEGVMIGTTQFTNAVVERRELAPTAAIRIALPSGKGLPPMVDWPEDIARALGQYTYMMTGGFLYDGWPLAATDTSELDTIIADLKVKGIKSVAVASVFSPMNPAPELEVENAIRRAIPDADITLSHRMGRLGIMERENAALLNAALLPFARRVVAAFQKAMKDRNLTCPMFVSQNDGTLMSVDFVRQFPALTFASGPTNSLRGASKLTGLKDAIVVDIGGTTSDIGVLQDGFPRESNVVVEVGGVRTNFRMPDITALGLGGGSLVDHGGAIVGPQSVGHKLVHKGLVFGGATMTATDMIVAAGKAQIGDPSLVAHIEDDVSQTAVKVMHEMLDRAIEMMKPNSEPVPVVLVGGGAVLVSGGLRAASKVLRPENAGVANAIGAAIAQVGGETERLVSYRSKPREEVIADITAEATAAAVSAGADVGSIKVADIEETSIPYMDEGNTRLRVKVIGDIAAIGGGQSGGTD